MNNEPEYRYEYRSEAQRNQPLNESFDMGRKAPAVAKRIFRTLNDAQLYIDNIDDNSTEGLRLTVLFNYIFIPDSQGREYGDDGYDTEDPNNRQYGDYDGVYRVLSIGDGVNSGELEKICRGSAAWFKGNAVSADGSSTVVYGAKVGDVYLNLLTLDTYILTNENDNLVWRLKGSLIVEHNHVYYKLSDNGTVHPEWSTSAWTRSNHDGTNIPNNYTQAFPNAAQVYLWCRYYDPNVPDADAKYTVSLVYSTLSLGTFTL